MSAKRILMVSYDFPPSWGGVATYSLEIAQGFLQKGFEVTVVTGKADVEFEAAGLKILRVPLASSAVASLPRLSLALVRILRDSSFDHIFCSLWLPDGLATYFALSWLRLETPYSISVHAMEIMENSETLRQKARLCLKPLKAKCFRAAKKIFPVSQFSRNQLISMISGIEENTHVINNGANDQVFSLSPHGKNPQFPRLLTACRLVPNKGVDQLLKALPRVLKTFPKLKLHICGQGPDHNRLVKLCEELKLSESVVFMGKLPLPELVSEFQKAHLFVMLSRQEKHFVEGFGLVFLEAALCGTASLGGQSGGIPDAIEDGVTGWLVNPLDQKAIEDKLLTILADQKELEVMAERARQKTLEGKTWKHRIDEFTLKLGL